MKNLILILLAITFSCGPEHIDYKQEESFWETYDMAYFGLLDVNNGDGLWKGSMREFLISEYWIPGVEYQFDLWLGTNCNDETGYCETYDFHNTFYESIPYN